MKHLKTPFHDREDGLFDFLIFLNSHVVVTRVELVSSKIFYEVLPHLGGLWCCPHLFVFLLRSNKTIITITIPNYFSELLSYENDKFTDTKILILFQFLLIFNKSIHNVISIHYNSEIRTY
jgi:hypothetical protein